MGWRIPRYLIGTSPVLVQEAFRFGADDNATPDSCTWDTQDTSRTNQPKNVKFMIRFLVNETAGANVATQSYQLYYDTDNTPSTATQVTTTDTVVTMSDGLPTDGASLDSAVCTGGSGSFIANYYCESDNSTAMQISKNNYTEFQFCVKLGNDAVIDTNYYFFVRQGAGVVLDTYSSTPYATAKAGAVDATPTPSALGISGGAQSPTINIISNKTIGVSVLSLASESQSPTPIAQTNATTQPSEQSISSEAQNPTITAGEDETAQPTELPLSLSANAPVIDHYGIFLFKKRLDYEVSFQAVWEGQSSLAPSSNPVYLLVYNRVSQQWETLASNNLVGADTDFTLQGSKSSNLSNYYDNRWVSFIVYQKDSSFTLQTDFFDVTTPSFVAPDTQQVSLTAETPSFAISSTREEQIDELSLQAYAPQIVIEDTISLSASALALSVETPNISAGNDKTIYPQALGISLSEASPVARIDEFVGVGSTNLSLTTLNPSVAKETQIGADLGQISLSAHAPSIIISSNVFPETQNISGETKDVGFAITGNIIKTPNPQALALSQPAPTISISVTYQAESIGLTTEGQSPSETSSPIVSPNTLSISITQNSPTFSISPIVSLSVLGSLFSIPLPAVGVISDKTIQLSSLSLISALNTPTISFASVIYVNALSIATSLNSPVQNISSTISLSLLQANGRVRDVTISFDCIVDLLTNTLTISEQSPVVILPTSLRDYFSGNSPLPQFTISDSSLIDTSIDEDSTLTNTIGLNSPIY